MELPKEELTTASGYSIQSLIAAAARASKTLPVPGSRKRAAAARASKTLPVPASRKRAAVARAGALPAQPAAEQKPKVKPKAKQAATVPARARVKVAAKDAEQSSAAAAAAAAGASQVRKRKREALAGGSAAASTVIASKRGNAAVRRIKVGQRSVSEMAASMPTAVKVLHLLCGYYALEPDIDRDGSIGGKHVRSACISNNTTWTGSFFICRRSQRRSLWRRIGWQAPGQGRLGRTRRAPSGGLLLQRQRR